MVKKHLLNEVTTQQPSPGEWGKESDAYQQKRKEGVGLGGAQQVNRSWVKSKMVTAIDQGMQEWMTSQPSIHCKVSPIRKHTRSHQ